MTCNDNFMCDRIPCVEVRIRANEHFLASIIKIKYLIRTHF